VASIGPRKLREDIFRSSEEPSIGSATSADISGTSSRKNSPLSLSLSLSLSEAADIRADETARQLRAAIREDFGDYRKRARVVGAVTK